MLALRLGRHWQVPLLASILFPSSKFSCPVMADGSPPDDPEQSPDQWEELARLLPVSSPEEVVNHIRTLQHVQERLDAETLNDVPDALTALQDRANTLEEQQSVLQEAGFEMPEYALHAIDSMEQQLDELYNEKEVTERTDREDNLRQDGDTFDQIQALLAREEKLQRQLGVSNPDDIVEMVEGLTDQLEDVYRDRDADTDEDSISPPSLLSSDSSSSDSELSSVFEEAFGVSDPEAAVTMLHDLTDQLEELYSGRERLTEFNLNGADEAIAMVQNMQKQLETLYEKQEQMSEHGVEGLDHALSMIETMEAQLNELQETPPEPPNANGLSDLDDAGQRLDTLKEKLSTLTEEKERLREKRDQLQEHLDTLAEEFGTQNPDAIADLVRSMEDQLEDVYAEREQLEDTSASAADDLPLLDDAELARLDDMDDVALNELSVGVFGLDDQGTVQRANDPALHWPDVSAETPEALLDASFFSDLAPAARNTLFQGRFEDGVQEGALNDAFLYTYVGEQAPLTNLAVHLYSGSDQSTYWIVFQVEEQYQ